MTLTDLHAARERIAPHVLRTPLQHSPLLSRRVGRPLWLKLENRQHTGSFKPRGALSKILALDASERARGLVAASAGNHALGVAHAARALGLVRVRVFVQGNAAPAKLEKLALYPVEVELAGTSYEDAHQAAIRYARETGATYVSAYDDAAVVAGQGTCGLELAEDAPADLEAVVVPVGGGALSAGVAVAIKGLRPGTRVIGVNPEASPSALRSFREGRAFDPFDHEPTLAHGLAGGYGAVPFAIARDLIDEIVLVSEAEIRAAIIALVDSDQLIVEPSGAAAVAAVLAAKVAPRGGGPVAAVVSGGNLDAAGLRAILA